MNEKEYEECFERLDKYVFNKEIKSKEELAESLAIKIIENFALKKVIEAQDKQLQAHKDKEDKLKEYISELSNKETLLAQGFEPMYASGIIFAYEITKEDILQILNEGNGIK